MNRDRLVVGIDPGSEHVGYSMGIGHDEDPVCGELPPRVFIGMLEGTTVSRVAIERFDIRQFTNDAAETVKLIGVMEYICDRKMIDIGWVNASSKKKFIEEIDPSITGHARDAEAVRLYDYYYGTW